MHQLAYILAFTITGDGILFKIVLALIITDNEQARKTAFRPK